MEPTDLESIRALARAGRTGLALTRLDSRLQAMPDDLPGRVERAAILTHLGRPREAERDLARALVLAPAAATAATQRGHAALHRERHARAVAWYARALAADPGAGAARHLHAALTGRTLPHAPPDYVRAVFDRCAARFDDILVGRLNYRAPQCLADLLARTAPDRRFARTLDLGCGTGLAGAELRERTDHLTGIDLAPAMIDQARARAVHDHLEVAEAHAFLAAATASWDLVVAADVLNYVGRLDDLFAAVAARTAPHGLFAFTIETGREDLELGADGRFRHGLDHVRRLAARQWRIRADSPTVLREEALRPVAGHVFVLERGVS